jgi:peptide chain release factor 2
VSALSDRIQELHQRVDRFRSTIKADEKRARMALLEARMAQPGFWDDQAAVQAVMGELKAIKTVMEPFQELADGIQACQELAELATGDAAAEADLNAECARLDQAYEKLEIRLALGGKYDGHDVYLSITPGAGGVEACDWADMLLRMYANYCQKAGYRCEVFDHQPGEEAGIKGAILTISGPFAYGYFKSEMGTHRLVRMSPFNAAGKRQTSFAAVEVTPVLPEAEVIGSKEDLDESQFRIDVYRASGAGGQHVNKTESAVRITHISTGIATACQTERSQIQNRAKAWAMMVAKLQQLKEAERLDELKDLMGERGTIGWGHQIRSYFLQPTQLIKDLRTGHEETNAHRVLDGDLQALVDSYLRWRLNGSPDRRTQGNDD